MAVSGCGQAVQGYKGFSVAAALNHKAAAVGLGGRAPLNGIGAPGGQIIQIAGAFGVKNSGAAGSRGDSIAVDGPSFTARTRAGS